MRSYPALDASWPAPPDDDSVGFLLADIDDHAPLAVEDRPLGVRLFFADEATRDAARATLEHSRVPLVLTSLSVDDDDWAERSQAALRPVTVGRCVVTPPWALEEVRASLGGGNALAIIIQPSMGFGTGHHASTRLCLDLFQRHLTPGARVLDVGTGSGVLALAAAALGASDVVAVDVDRDALQSAAENVALNGAARSVSLAAVDITNEQDAARLVAARGPFDVVFANITGAMLRSIAPTLHGVLARAGIVIASGFEAFEADEVGGALAATGMEVVDRGDEESWTALVARRRS